MANRQFEEFESEREEIYHRDGGKKRGQSWKNKRHQENRKMTKRDFENAREFQDEFDGDR